MSAERRELGPQVLVAQLHVDITEQFTTAVVQGSVNGVEVGGLGTAKRNPCDSPNRQIGANLALSRALIDLGLELERQTLELDQRLSRGH